MTDILIENGTVITMNDARDIVPGGSVLIDGNRIERVEEGSDSADDVDADRVIDADGCAVLPGFISSHVHVSDILFRGLSDTRALHDWLFNVEKPAYAKMTAEDHELAAALYCLEATRSGITTFVENAIGPGSGFDDDAIESKLDVYETAGIRNVYAHGFTDAETAGEITGFIRSLERSEPDIEHVGRDFQSTEEALDRTESLMDQYHDTAAGRQSVWPGPAIAYSVSPDALARSYELAESYDVMTTIHTSETALEERGPQSTVQYLNNCGYLGDRTLLGHCVHVSERDMRILAATGTRVAHNPVANLHLGSGIAPVPSMINHGITMGLGTDNTSISDTVNMLTDMRYAALIHKGHRQDAGAMTAEKVLEMATIDGARAIGREHDLGSLEPGKLADIVIVDLDQPHLTPTPNVPSAIVYQTLGHEVQTVICNGSIVMAGRTDTPIESTYPTLLDRVTRRATRLRERAGLDHLASAEWQSIADR